MSCRRVRGVLLEYVFNELEGDDLAWLESHLDGCKRCRRRASGLRRLWRTLPEPYPGPLAPDRDTWEQSWNAILGRLSEPPELQPTRPQSVWPAPLRWATMAAALGTAFILGRHWDEVRPYLQGRLGQETTASAGYYAGLDSFQASSDQYLRRSRLLLLELQLSNAVVTGFDDPWLVGHSRNLLGEVPRLRRVAQRIQNPQLEGLLGDLEIILNQLLEISGSGDSSLPPEVRTDLDSLLFKLEMLEQRGSAPRVAALPAAS